MPRKKTVNVENNIEESRIEVKETDKNVYTATCRVNVRSEPSLNAPVVRVSDVGSEVEVDAIEDDWMRLVDGTYTMAEFWTVKTAE